MPPQGPPTPRLVTDREVRNPKAGPAIRRWAKGSWILVRLNKPSKMITTAMVIRKTLGLAVLRAKTPMGVAANPPTIRPILARVGQGVGGMTITCQ